MTVMAFAPVALGLLVLALVIHDVAYPEPPMAPAEIHPAVVENFWQGQPR